MANSSVVGALRVIFYADTAEFASAMRKASDTVDQAAKDVQKAGASFAALEPRMASVTRLVKDFSGSLERRSAEEFALAIDKIGGAAKLSESELRRAQGVFSDYISKAKALGQEVPPHIAKLNAEIDKLHPSSAKASQGLGMFDASWKKLLAGFSAVTLIDRAVRSLVNFATEAVTSASRIVDLSNKTGLGIESLQRFEFVANQTGTSLDAFSDASFKLGTNLTAGTGKIRKAVSDLGLSFGEIVAMKPDQQLDTVARALGALTNVQERNTIGVALLGRGYKELSPAIEEYSELVGQAAVASEASVRRLDEYADKVSKLKDTITKEFINELGRFLELLEGGPKEQKNLPGLLPGERMAGSLLVLATEATKAQDEAEALAATLAGSYANATKVGAKNTADFVKELAAAQKEIRDLSKADREQIDAMLKMGGTWDDLPPKIHLSEVAQKIYASTTKDATKAIKDSEKAINENKKAVEQSAKEYRDWSDAATGAKLLRDLGELENKLDRLTKELTPNERALRAVAEEANKLGRDIGFLPPRLQTLVNQFVAFRSVTIGSTTALPALSSALNVTGDEIRRLADQDLANLNKKLQDFQKIINTPAGTESLFKGGTTGKEIQDLQATYETFGEKASKALFTVANAFQEVGTVVGGETGDILRGVGSIAAGLGFLASGDYVTGAVSIVSGFAQMETLWRNIARDTQDAFATRVLGFQNLNELMQRLRDLGAHDLINQGDRAQRKDDEEATRIWMEDVLKFFAEVDAIFDRLGTAAGEFGGKAPLALQPFIQELLKANALTEKQRALLEGLAGAPEWQHLQSIAEKYGIELSSLGQSFQDARIGDTALQYARDFITLRDAGGDVNGLLQGMQDEVQALILDSLKFGTALPEALRDVVQGLIDMGGLVDENGQALTDLSRFTFTGTLEDVFKDMKSILEEIRDLLSGEIPKAAARGAQGVEDEFSGAFDRIRQRARTMPVSVPVEFDYGAFSPPQGFGLSDPPQMAEGGITTRGGLFELHRNEAVIPLSDGLAIGRDEYEIHLHNYLDGRKVAEVTLPHTKKTARKLGIRPI